MPLAIAIDLSNTCPSAQTCTRKWDKALSAMVDVAQRIKPPTILTCDTPRIDLQTGKRACALSMATLLLRTCPDKNAQETATVLGAAMAHSRQSLLTRFSLFKKEKQIRLNGGVKGHVQIWANTVRDSSPKQ